MRTVPLLPTPPSRPRRYHACAERGARRFGFGRALGALGYWLSEAGRDSEVLVVLRNVPLDCISKLVSLPARLAFARPWNLGWDPS